MTTTCPHSRIIVLGADVSRTCARCGEVIKTRRTTHHYPCPKCGARAGTEREKYGKLSVLCCRACGAILEGGR